MILGELVISSLRARNRSMACEMNFYTRWYMLNEFHHAFLNIKTPDDYLHIDIADNFVIRQSCTFSFILKPREMGLIHYINPIGCTSGHLYVSIHFNPNKSQLEWLVQICYFQLPKFPCSEQAFKI